MNQITLAKDQSVLAYLTEKLMQNPPLQIQSFRKPSQQMQAMLLILNADPYLMKAVSPYVNLETESIYWEKIQRLPLGSGHKAVVAWARVLWTDEMPKGNVFDGVLSLSPFFKVAILEALCLRWGLRG